MKNRLFYLVFCFLPMVMMKAQSPPFVLSHTILPPSPTSFDQIKIITKVISPNQAVEVDKTYSVTTSPLKLKISMCYGGSMLPATQTFVDTFSIGQLLPGVYSLEHWAYASAAQQWCNKTDSVLSASVFTVSTITAISDQKMVDRVEIFPNPSSGLLQLNNVAGFREAWIYSVTGALLKIVSLEGTDRFSIAELSDGIYILKLQGNNTPKSLRVVKQSN